MSDLSIIVLNYNTHKITTECLKRVESALNFNCKAEIICIDNASSDGSPDVLENYLKKIKRTNIQTKLIKNSQNLGFAKANNQGIKIATGDYILLLNSDVMIEKEVFQKQLQFMASNPQYDVSTCKIVLKDGNIDPACHRGFPTPWASFTYFSGLEKIFPANQFFSQYHQGWKDQQKVHDIDVISGAFFMAKKDVFTKVGLFDEDYFMYAEDIDFCFRLKQKGLRIGFNPENTVVHLKGVSGKSKKGDKANSYFWDTMKLFYQKHYSEHYPKSLQTLIFKFIDLKKGSSN
jgi:GT2 family glycosyltransferase